MWLIGILGGHLVLASVSPGIAVFFVRSPQVPRASGVEIGTPERVMAGMGDL
jgi:hypothetical protein